MFRNKHSNVFFLVDFGRVLHGSARAANTNKESYFSLGTVTLICRIYLFVNLRATYPATRNRTRDHLISARNFLQSDTLPTEL